MSNSFLNGLMQGSEFGARAKDRREAGEQRELEQSRKMEMAKILRGQVDPARQTAVANAFSFAGPQNGGNALAALGTPPQQPDAQPFGRGNLASARDKALEWGDVQTGQQFHAALQKLDAADRQKVQETAEDWSRTIAYVLDQPLAQQGPLIREHGARFNVSPEQIERYANEPWLLGPVKVQNDELMKAFAENQKDYTLSDGQERYAGGQQGQRIAHNAPDPMSLSAGSVMVDPTNGQRIAEGNTPAALDPRVLGQKDRGLDLEARRLAQSPDGGGMKRSLNPVPLQGPDGYALGQVTSDGQLIPVQSPNGYAPLDPFNRKFAEAQGGAMGKGAADAAERAPKWERKLSAFQDKSKFLKDTIDRAIEQSNGRNTGPIMGRNPFATNLQATLRTVQANMGFDALQDMRDNSPTGGALGQVSEREIDFLQALAGDLQRSQSQEQLDANLQRLYQHLDGQEARLRQAYEQDLSRGLINDGGRGPLSYIGGGSGSGSDYIGGGTNTGWTPDMDAELQALEAELGGAR